MAALPRAGSAATRSVVLTMTAPPRAGREAAVVGDQLVQREVICRTRRCCSSREIVPLMRGPICSAEYGVRRRSGFIWSRRFTTGLWLGVGSSRAWHKAFYDKKGIAAFHSTDGMNGEKVSSLFAVVLVSQNATTKNE